MTRPIHRGEEPVLGEREAEVLKAIIRAHILSGDPVGSKTVSRGSRLSPASIRNIMAMLEERGMLSQPHTSAGRIPTDHAYRLYVDHLMGRPRMAAARAQAIEDAMSHATVEVEDLLLEASRVLSRFSDQVGVVVAPDIGRIVVEKIEFARIADHRVVAVVVARSGFVHHRVLDVAEPMEQDELDRIGRYLGDQFGGMTLPRIREELQRSVRADQAAYDRLVARSLELGLRTVEVDEVTTDVFVEGTANLLEQPEFADVDRMRGLLRALEQKRRLVRLLNRVLESNGVRIMIGSETLDENLVGCSLVASSYRSGERVMGTVGIVGPTRMEYVKAVALVEYLARVLTRRFTDPDTGAPRS